VVEQVVAQSLLRARWGELGRVLVQPLVPAAVAGLVGAATTSLIHQSWLRLLITPFAVGMSFLLVAYLLRVPALHHVIRSLRRRALPPSENP
jgi:hypothetical protein